MTDENAIEKAASPVQRPELLITRDDEVLIIEHDRAKHFVRAFVAKKESWQTKTQSKE